MGLIGEEGAGRADEIIMSDSFSVFSQNKALEIFVIKNK